MDVVDAAIVRGLNSCSWTTHCFCYSELRTYSKGVACQVAQGAEDADANLVEKNLTRFGHAYRQGGPEDE